MMVAAERGGLYCLARVCPQLIREGRFTLTQPTRWAEYAGAYLNC
jgi:hypothetical protein